MGGGGKGGGGGDFSQPSYVDPVTGKSFGTSDDLNAEITQRMAADKTTSDASTAAATAKAAQDEADFQTRAGAAKDQATQNITQYFKDQGIDPTGYAPQIAAAVNTASGNVADLDPAPGGKYAPTLGSDLFNQIQAGKQTQNLASYNSAFAPSYSQTALDSSLIDPAVDSALKTQSDPLAAGLTNAQKRGTLTGSGYDAALQALQTSMTGGRATVNKLAQGVLDSDRQGLDQYIGTGRSAAGSAPLGSTFSADPYISGAKDMTSRDVANFGGDVQNAVGNTKFTDLTSLLNAGGNVQGANDPTATNPLGAVGSGGQPIGGPGGGDLSPSFIAAQALAKDPRGLGTQGAF